MNQLEKRIAFCLSGLKENEKLGNHDNWAGAMSNKEIVETLAKTFDPTDKGLYLSWIVKRYKDQQFLLSEEARVLSTLNTFDSNKRQMPAESRDINKIKSLEDLQNLVQPFTERGPELSKRKQEALAKVQGAEVILQTEIGRLLEIKEFEAARLYGMGTTWCTTSSERHYENYKDGLYVILLTNGRKYQFHDRTSSFMDEQDVPRKIDSVDADYREFVKLSLFQTAAVNLIKNDSNLSLNIAEHPNLREGVFRVLEGESVYAAQSVFKALQGVDVEFILEANTRIPTNRKGLLLQSDACPSSIVNECLNSDCEENIQAALSHPACDVNEAVSKVNNEGAILAISRNPRASVEIYGKILEKALSFSPKTLSTAAFNLSKNNNIATIKAAIANRDLWSILPKQFMGTPKEVLLHIARQPGIDLATRQGIASHKSIDLSEVGEMDMTGVRMDMSLISATKEMTENVYSMVINSGARLDILRALDKRGVTNEAADTLVQRGYAQTVAFHEKTSSEIAIKVFNHLDHEDQGTLLLRKPLSKECAQTYLEASTNGKRALQVVMNPGVTIAERAELLDLLYRKRAEFNFDRPTAGAVRDAANRIRQEINPQRQSSPGM